MFCWDKHCSFLEGGSFHFEPQERGVAPPKTPVQNFPERFSIRWPEKPQNFRVCI